MFESLGVPPAVIRSSKPLNRVKIEFPKCQICNKSPWMESTYWAIDNKICENCMSLVDYNYQNVKDELTLEEYIDTIIIANNLTKE